MNQNPWKNYRPLEWIFYGNFFYGICAVAQSVEATLQQFYPLNQWWYYVLIFLATVLYYNYPYARKYTHAGNNPRTAWYMRHERFIYYTQVIVSVTLLSAGLAFAYNYHAAILQMNMKHLCLLLVFPVVAALYYGSNVLSTRRNLRSIGWLKPFVIGFTWAGLVEVYPILFYDILHGRDYDVTLFGTLLFFKNLMFISLLCIMFDVKDYASDHAQGLKTIVGRMGLKKTIFYILLPLPLLGLLTFITYALTHQFHIGKIILNMIPFLLLLLTALSFRKRHSLMYYLVVIDGLMLVKAICGTVAMLLF